MPQKIVVKVKDRELKDITANKIPVGLVKKDACSSQNAYEVLKDI